MSNNLKSFNDKAWERLFEKYDILKQVEINGSFEISAIQIKEFRDPKLMTEFNHSINLPKIFADNKLAILPIAKGDYLISHFDAYHTFEEEIIPITRVSFPPYVQSLDPSNISSDMTLINCAVATRIITDFLEDEEIVTTFSGRKVSSPFFYDINNTVSVSPVRINVSNFSIETDIVFEGINTLSLFNVKRDLSSDFLIRQIYYPYRLWKNWVAKPIRSIFLIYSNGIYRLYEYMFQVSNNYNSLVLIKQQNYSIEDTSISVEDIQSVLNSVKIIQEPAIPFPQANTFERIINLCELLNEQELSRNEVTEKYAFNARQTNYYTDAARYLGLLEKRSNNGSPNYCLTSVGKRLLNLSFKQRQLAYCKLILSHKAFNETLKEYFARGIMPAESEIINIMKISKLYNIRSDNTFMRRSSTIKGWINWIVGLLNE